jgi:hypothetical protein
LIREIVVIAVTAKIPDLFTNSSFGIEKELRLGSWISAVAVSSIPWKKAIISCIKVATFRLV